MSEYLDKTGLSYLWSKIKTKIASSKAETINAVYPVGSIYMSTESTNPASLFGGTWRQLQGEFLVGVDNTDEKYAANKIGFVAAASADTPNIVPYLNVYMWERTA